MRELAEHESAAATMPSTVAPAASSPNAAYVVAAGDTAASVGRRTTAPPTPPADAAVQRRATGGSVDCDSARRLPVGPGSLVRPADDGASARSSLAAAQPAIQRSGAADLSDVQVHYDSHQPARIGAAAFTRGNEIHLGPGQEQHLGHEAWHVVQQREGRVAPTTTLSDGTVINDDPALEHEADVMGARLTGPIGRPATGGGSDEGSPVQGKWFVIDFDPERQRAKRETIEELVMEDRWLEAFQTWYWPDQYYTRVMEKYIDLAKADGTARAVINGVIGDTYESERDYFTFMVLADLERAASENETLGARLRDAEEMEDLIQRFGQMNISEEFESDIPGQFEMHAVKVVKDDIVVASNPKPLKQVVLDKEWQGVQIQQTDLDKLDLLRKGAKDTLYRIGGNAKRGYQGARTTQNMESLRSQLKAIGNILSQLHAKAPKAHNGPPPTDLSQSLHHGKDSAPVEGRHVIADRLSINSATRGSKPHDGRVMKALRKLAGVNSKSYVQMHLLNDLVFGPGQLWNLTPGPKQSNVDMEKKIEDPLKRAVLGKGLVLRFEAIVDYDNDPNTETVDAKIDHSPVSYVFKKIDFKATQLEYDGPSKSWKPAVVQDPLVTAINNKSVKWDYGNLPRLVDKPSLSDPPDAASLKAVGIPNAAAVRIAAFMQANKAWRPTTNSNKQAQLAEAVSGFDGKRKPSMDWNANLIYWT